MIKENQKILNFLNILGDAAIIFISYFPALRIRFEVLDGVWSINLYSGEFITLVAVYSVITVFIYYLMHLYSPKRFDLPWSMTLRIFGVNAVCTLGLVTVLYLGYEMEFSRLALAIFYLISSVLVVIKHGITKAVLQYYRRKGYNLKHVILVGSGLLAHQYAADVISNPQMGFQIDGYISDEEHPELGKWFGPLYKITEILATHDADELVIALGAREERRVPAVIIAAHKEGIRTHIIPAYNEYIPPHPYINVIGDTKLINLNATPLDNIGPAGIKRLFDIVASFLGIVLTSPILLATAIGVKLSSPGPVFFVQERVGKDKKVFKMLKFRSMRVNAQENSGWSKLDDPRKTKFGAFIRKLSIDELPQLFNVLVGQMSLVGPRPELQFHVDHFKEEIPQYLVRQQIRPGMTGWAQINGFRGDTSIEQRIHYDLWYINNWSLMLDAKILMRTVLGGFLNPETVPAKEKPETEEEKAEELSHV